MSERIIDLGDELSKILHERAGNFKKFYLETVRKDPTLNKMWSFCFEKDLLHKNPAEFYYSRLHLLKQGHISKSDFFHLNEAETNALPEDRVFYDFLRLLTFITAKVIYHKRGAEEAGYDIPINKLISAHSIFQRIEADRQIKEVNYFSLPDFIEEYTRTKDKTGGIHEDICLLWLLPPTDKTDLFQYLQNYFENYTVELLQKSSNSRDITFGNASFIRVSDIESEKDVYPTHTYSISLDIGAARTKLIDCSLGEKYKPLILQASKDLSKKLKAPSGYEDDGIRWAEARQLVETEFYELLAEFDPEEHGHLAGYLKQGLVFWRGRKIEKLTAKKRDPGGALVDEDLTTIIEIDPLGHPVDPEDQVINKEEVIKYQKIYQKFKKNVSAETKRFLEIWQKDPEATEKELAEKAGISKAMVKKHKTYIRAKIQKDDNPF